MITCSKTLQIPVKKTSWTQITLSISTFQKEKLQFPETRIWLWKSSNLCSNCKPFAWKMHLSLQKAAWEVKIASRGAIICKHWIISQYTCNNALGFELQSARNLHRDKKAHIRTSKCTQTCTGTKKQKFWTSKCTKPAEGQNNKSFELQSAPNLQRDKKNKKTKRQQKLYILLGKGRLYPSKGFVCFVFLSPCRFGALWSSKFLFFCPCAGLEHFKLKPLLFLCLWRFWLIRKSPIKALDKEKEELRVMRAVFKKGEWIKEGRVLLKGRI